MTDSAFSRYFKRMSGQTFSDTVRKLRLAQACKLLEDSDLPVSAICYRVGYTNLSNFNRQFRAQHGITPSEFRRANR
jgi:AraC-like DNA-binding protein